MTPARRNFFYFGICHFCKNVSEKIQRCGSCKTVAYCSKQHQKFDWRSHRDLCKAIVVTSKTPAKNLTFEEWKNYRVYCQLAWTMSLKRQLEPFECQMWMFPRVCGVCCSKENLMDCTQCRNVAYCSNEHAKQHKAIHDKFCEDLKLCMNIDRYFAKENSYPPTQLPEKISSIQQLPKDMSELMNQLEKPAILDTDEPVKRVLKADCVAPGATIVYAIKSSEVTQFRGAPLENQLIIHVVGSSAAEGTADWGITTELIFHLIGNLKEVTYIFIGPEAWQISENLELCRSCKTHGKVLNVKVYQQLYHEVVDVIEKPSLVISFNSGLHEFEGQDGDQWLNSIPCLVKNPESPFVFTSYTEEEMLRDLERLRSIPNVELSVLTSGKNPFASPRPIRDWCTKDIPVFYSNGYIAMVRRH